LADHLGDPRGRAETTCVSIVLSLVALYLLLLAIVVGIGRAAARRGPVVIDFTSRRPPPARAREVSPPPRPEPARAGQPPAPARTVESLPTR
jgi:hypothetical protein